MKTMILSDLKAHLSDVIQDVIAGEEIAIGFGRRREIVACLISRSARKSGKRKLGQWQGKGTVTFANDFTMTKEDFLGLH